MAGPEDHDVGIAPTFINAFKDPVQYAFPSRAQKRKPLRADYRAHADALLGQLVTALGAVPRPAVDHRLGVAGLKLGTVIGIFRRSHLRSTPGAKPPRCRRRLSSRPDIVLLRTERQDNRSESALLFVPDDARGFLQGRIDGYGRDPGNELRADLDRFEVVESIAPAPARSLFVGRVNFVTLPEILWWELSIQGGITRAERITALARSANLDIHSDRLLFPDTTVMLSLPLPPPPPQRRSWSGCQAPSPR